MTIQIDTFRPEHAARFAELNREWLEKYNLMEPSDERQIADPQAYFIDCGGQIFVAVHDGHVVGTCAAVPHGAGEFELVKLAVSRGFEVEALPAAW